MRTLAGVSSARTALMADSSYSWGTLCSASSRSLHADQTRSHQIRPDQTRSDQIRSDHTRSHQIRPDQSKRAEEHIIDVSKRCDCILVMT